MTRGAHPAGAASHRRDLVFILLQITSLTSAAIILSLAHKYRAMVCDAHPAGLKPRTLE